MTISVNKRICKLEVQVNNCTDYSFSKRQIRDVCCKAIDLYRAHNAEKEEFSISIALVGQNEMRKLNRGFRKKDKVTDVLSFCEEESIPDIIEEGQKKYLGEIILCPSYIDNETQFFVALAHGTLHLLGARHGKKMFAIQEEAGSSIIKKVSKNKDE